MTFVAIDTRTIVYLPVYDAFASRFFEKYARFCFSNSPRTRVPAKYSFIANFVGWETINFNSEIFRKFSIYTTDEPVKYSRTRAKRAQPGYELRCFTNNELSN